MGAIATLKEVKVVVDIRWENTLELVK
jgi:hypothetical protein